MLKVLSDIWSIPELRRRILVVFSLLAVYRLGFHIYLPGVKIEKLASLFEKMASDASTSGIMDFVRITSNLTGGQLQQATIFSLGIMPYISASIIFSLLVKVFPAMEALQKEGESGRQQINKYTRYATVVLCLIQSLIVVQFLHSPNNAMVSGALSDTGFGIVVTQILCLTAGTVFLMWLGEKITEYGIGNGVSLIIMAGIIAQMPASLLGMIADIQRSIGGENSDETPFLVLKLIILGITFFAIVVGVVYITRGQRRIPVQQARTVKGRKVYGGQRHYMPIRVNSAGVLPIIFAQSLIMIPTGVIGFLSGGGGNWFTDLFAFGSFTYSMAYVLMIGFFTYFWTSLMFNPVEISQNMKENGTFIPGIRPGRRTAEYLEQVINRITLAGASFLAGIALVPQMLSSQLNVQMAVSSFLGGTGILIVVGVALDLVDKIEAQLLVRQYEGFMQAGGGSKGGGPAGSPQALGDRTPTAEPSGAAPGDNK